MEALVKIVKDYYGFVFGLLDLADKLADWLENYRYVPPLMGAVAFTLLFEYLYITRASEVVLGFVLLVLPIAGVIVGAIVGHFLGIVIVMAFVVVPAWATMFVLILGPPALIVYAVFVFLFSTVIVTN